MANPGRGRTGASSWSDRDAHKLAHGSRYRHTNSDANAHADSHADAKAEYPYAQPYPNRDPPTSADAYSHADGGAAHGHASAAGGYQHTRPDVDPDADGDEHTCPDVDLYADVNRHAWAECHSHSHTYADRFDYALADTHDCFGERLSAGGLRGR